MVQRQDCLCLPTLAHIGQIDSATALKIVERAHDWGFRIDNFTHFMHFHAMILESIDFWWIWLPHIRDLFLQNFRTSTVVKILICDWRGWKEILVRLSHRWPTFRFSTTTSGFFQCGNNRAWSFLLRGWKSFQCNHPWKTHVGWILLTMSGSLIDTSSTAQGGGGSFKKRKRIGEIGCCESQMSAQKHWPTD